MTLGIDEPDFHPDDPFRLDPILDPNSLKPICVDRTAWYREEQGSQQFRTV